MIQGEEVDVFMWKSGGLWYVRIKNDEFAVCGKAHKNLLKAYVRSCEEFAGVVMERAQS